MSNIPGGGFEIAQSNGYMFTNAVTDDFIIHTTVQDQRLLLAASSNGQAAVIVTSNAVGINTSNSPQFTLDVLGDINFTGKLYQGSSEMITSRWSSNNTLSNIYKEDGRVTIGSNIFPEVFNVYNGNAKFDSNAYVMSRVAIGTSNPTQALHVEGNTYLSSNLRVDGNIDTGKAFNMNALYIRRSSNAVSQTTISTSITNVNVQGDNMVLSIKGTAADNSFTFTAGSNPSNLAVLTADAKFGINTTQPLERLHVEQGSVFVGNSQYRSNVTNPQATNHKLVFDNSYNSTAGSGAPANKIVLFNQMDNVQPWLGGFGVESSSMTYHSGGAHTFYTNSSHANYGTATMYIDAMGNIVAKGDLATFGTISDSNLKTDVHTLSNSLSLVESLRPVNFVWKDDIFQAAKRNTADVGFIAQEVESVLPLATSEYVLEGTTYKNLKHERIIPYLVDAIQELSRQVKDLRSKLEGTTFIN